MNLPGHAPETYAVRPLRRALVPLVGTSDAVLKVKAEPIRAIPGRAAVKVGKWSTKRLLIVGAAVVGVAVVAFALAFEPVTRNFVARDKLCFYCHLEFEYTPTRLVSTGTPHPRTRGGPPARCVDCHLPRGFMGAVDAWTHFASITDLYGHFRDRASERAGDWIPPQAAMAYRVRDRLFENDSPTCRGCHVLSKIKPRSARGRTAHRRAEVQHRTCIECHFNLAHHQVALRPDAFGGPRARFAQRGAAGKALPPEVREILESTPNQGSHRDASKS